MTSDFKCIFEPILHADKLPREVVAEIHIKDAEKTIKSSLYPSPQNIKRHGKYSYSNI